ncbi:hypothetical protein AAEX28_07640 [Lentisphaerota bacterium WC36G]|nr:hypothetical protein LJT99_10500 [Lentisphaerae bacterium WC36]
MKNNRVILLSLAATFCLAVGLIFAVVFFKSKTQNNLVTYSDGSIKISFVNNTTKKLKIVTKKEYLMHCDSHVQSLVKDKNIDENIKKMQDMIKAFYIQTDDESNSLIVFTVTGVNPLLSKDMMISTTKRFAQVFVKDGKFFDFKTENSQGYSCIGKNSSWNKKFAEMSFGGPYAFSGTMINNDGFIVNVTIKTSNQALLEDFKQIIKTFKVTKLKKVN